MLNFSNILSGKSAMAAFFLVIMLFVLVEGISRHHGLINDFQTELTDTDGDKETEKKETEKKEKESESEDFLISSLQKQSSDFIRFNSLNNHFKANWCNPERQIITPPPEQLG